MVYRKLTTKVFCAIRCRFIFSGLHSVGRVHSGSLRSVGLEVTHLYAIAQMGDVGGSAHGFLATSSDDLGRAISDLLHVTVHTDTIAPFDHSRCGGDREQFEGSAGAALAASPPVIGAFQTIAHCALFFCVSAK